MTLKVVIPLGYDTTWILPKLVSLRPTPRELAVVTVPGDERAEMALKSLELTVDGLAARGLPLDMEVVRVDPEDYPSLLAACLDVVSPGDGVTVLLGGGMRVLSVALLQASLATPGTRVEVLLEGRDRWVEVSARGTTECCLMWLSGIRGRMLVELESGPKTLDELSRLLRRSKSTLSGHLDELEEVGLLERTSRKPAIVRLTPAGRSIVGALGGGRRPRG